MTGYDTKNVDSKYGQDTEEKKEGKEEEQKGGEGGGKQRGKNDQTLVRIYSGGEAMAPPLQ